MTGTLNSLSKPSYMLTSHDARRQQFSRARRDAIKAIAADIPDPRDYAQYLESRYVVLLLSATLREFWYVTPDAARELRPLGLCEYGGTALTVFGMQVRRALKAMDE